MAKKKSKELNREQAHKFIMHTYADAELDQLLVVKRYYNAQIKDPNIQKVQFYSCEKLDELIEKKQV